VFFFFDHNLCLQSINGSYITLIPKVDNPIKDSDFRPISCPLMFLLKNAVFGCYLPLSGRGRELPFTCLGLPPSHMKPSTHDCLTLVTRVERRLVSTSIFLSQGGKLQMVNSVLSSLPTFYMCSIKFPVKIVNHIEKYRRHCLWKGRDLNGKKPALAAWKLVTKPKMKGGLGVIRLRLQNEALLLNFLHKFFTKADILWVKLLWTKYYSNGKVPGQVMKGSLWWRHILKLLNTFKGIAHAHVGSGDYILFWKDM
jgi:hypothetical protein